MPDLHQAIAETVVTWRDAGYPHEDFPAVAEIGQEVTLAGTSVLHFDYNGLALGELGYLEHGRGPAPAAARLGRVAP